jgi:hypothetical protein
MEWTMATNKEQQRDAALAPIIGAVTIACGAVCATPPTSIVGALLWIGYCGNFVMSHMRIGGLLFALALAGPCLASMLWAGVGLRDRRRRAFVISVPGADHA